MRAVAEFIRRYPAGVAAPVLLIWVQLVEDFDGPGILALLFGCAGVVAFLAHFASSSVPWLLKRKSYGASLLDQILPLMLVWIVVVYLRAGLMLILGKPL